ncbi:MAG: hypothetical protein VKJ24_18580 [Synechococcales bacterium]|nr:hypothetical protein [Synechococcales bacterium]
MVNSAAKIAVIAVGALSASVLAAGTAKAENASVSGAVTYTSPAGFSLSYSAEKVAPTGFNFNGAVTVTGMPGADGLTPVGMTLDAGMVTPAGGAPTGATLKDAVIAKLSGMTDLNTPKQLDAYTAILKAAAGTDGLE